MEKEKGAACIWLIGMLTNLSIFNKRPNKYIISNFKSIKKNYTRVGQEPYRGRRKRGNLYAAFSLICHDIFLEVSNVFACPHTGWNKRQRNRLAYERKGVYLNV